MTFPSVNYMFTNIKTILKKQNIGYCLLCHAKLERTQSPKAPILDDTYNFDSLASNKKIQEEPKEKNLR